MAERNCLLLDSCLDKLYIVLQVWLFLFSFLSFFFRAVPYFRCFSILGFRAFGLSPEICNLFIRHSLCTTVISAGFSSGPRPVFPVGQPRLLGFSFLLLLALCFSSVG